MKLSQFGITYLPGPSIRWQALAHFLVECSLPVEEESNHAKISPLEPLPNPWMLFVDESSITDCSGEGILLISPEGFEIQQSIRFGFPATNNCSEYEALLAGLRLDKGLQVPYLKAHSDSQLIVNQVLRWFTAKSALMIKYLEVTRRRLLEFKIATLEGVPREENCKADTLARPATEEELPSALGIYKMILTSPSVNLITENDDQVLVVAYSPNWMTPIIIYLQEGKEPQEKKATRSLRT